MGGGESVEVYGQRYVLSLHNSCFVCECVCVRVTVCVCVCVRVCVCVDFLRNAVGEKMKPKLDNHSHTEIGLARLLERVMCIIAHSTALNHSQTCQHVGV